jgi:hypothetical protein
MKPLLQKLGDTLARVWCRWRGHDWRYTAAAGGLIRAYVCFRCRKWERP